MEVSLVSDYSSWGVVPVLRRGCRFALKPDSNQQANACVQDIGCTRATVGKSQTSPRIDRQALENY